MDNKSKIRRIWKSLKKTLKSNKKRKEKEKDEEKEEWKWLTVNKCDSTEVIWDMSTG